MKSDNNYNIFAFYSLLVEQLKTRDQIKEETKIYDLVFEDNLLTDTQKVICFIKGKSENIKKYIADHKKDYAYYDTKKGRAIVLTRGL